MQFAQAERGPTPLTACKDTLMKIPNFFFLGQTTHNELKIKNVRRGGLFSQKWPLFKNHNFVSSTKYRPNHKFLFIFPLVLSHKV